MSDQPSPTEADILEAMRCFWESESRFFSGKGEKKREHWVVREFLGRLSIAFAADELHSHEQKSKVDVEFRDARFQVKEITEPNCRRGAEIKDSYLLHMNAKTLKDTIAPVFGYDIPSILNGYDLVREGAQELSSDARYLQSKADLDLLFYVTRSRVSVVQQQEVKADELSSLGWRSISCLMGDRALVIFAHADAPAFLRREGS